jgi:nucleotide-binding universal stress UspA family protein
MSGVVRAVVWIVEGTWEATIDAAAALLPPDAQIELLHVAGDEEAFVRAGRQGLLGRHPPKPPPHERDPVSTASAEEARELLADARARLGRDATMTARRGRAAHEVLEALAGADLLVLARGGEPDHLGPKSIGHAARFVVDHAPCDVLLVRG